MEIPDILMSALRQYQHNNGTDLVAGFDRNETIRIVSLMSKALKAQSRLLVAYRTGGTPPDWVFNAIEYAKKNGINI